MSIASPASQVRREAMHAPSRAAASQAPSFEYSNLDDAIRINVADIPLPQESMDVDGFKPSLLSRLMDSLRR